MKWVLASRPGKTGFGTTANNRKVTGLCLSCPSANCESLYIHGWLQWNINAKLVEILKIGHFKGDQKRSIKFSTSFWPCRVGCTSVQRALFASAAHRVLLRVSWLGWVERANTETGPRGWLGRAYRLKLLLSHVFVENRALNESLKTSVLTWVQWEERRCTSRLRWTLIMTMKMNWARSPWRPIKGLLLCYLEALPRGGCFTLCLDKSG